MKLYIITKDGKPYNGSRLKEETFVKAYYSESVANKTAKLFCSTEANIYYRYGQGYYDSEDTTDTERNEMAKELARVEIKRWDVIELSL